MASLLAHLAPRTIPHAEMLGDDASDVLTCVAPAPGKGATTTPTTKALLRPLQRPGGEDARALEAFSRHPAVAALDGLPRAAVDFAPVLRHDLIKDRALLVDKARRAAIDGDVTTPQPSPLNSFWSGASGCVAPAAAG